MAKRSESRRSRPVRSPEAVGGESSGALAKLGERFELFRAQHGAGARVPDELRAAVFEALSEGMTVKDLRRECGLAGSQIDGWEGTRKRASEGQVTVLTSIDPSAGKFLTSIDPPRGEDSQGH